MPLIETKGAGSAQGFGLTGGGKKDAVYIEDVFSTYLYTGNGSTQTITNGIDLAGKGGLVWMKSRNYPSGSDNFLIDTSNGANYFLSTNTTDLRNYSASINWSFLNNGFSQNNNFSNGNYNGYNYVSWTFRKCPKFFDVVTYTGNGGAQSISHSLGQVPGMIITKATSTTGDWLVTLPSWGVTGNFLKLNATNARTMLGAFADNTGMTSTAFNVSSSNSVNGVTYVAYLFAHDTAADGLIQCGTFTTDGSGNATVTSLGWEPQFLMVKATSTTGDWIMLDIMRGWNMTATDARLLANSTAAETTAAETGNPTATGFRFQGGSASATYIYMAIRRGPMRVPTDPTKVFIPQYYSTPAYQTYITTGFPVDAQLLKIDTLNPGNVVVVDKLRQASSNATDSGLTIYTNSTTSEISLTVTQGWDNTGFKISNGVSDSYPAFWSLRRAPGFFDIVCYTSDGVSQRAINHNLTVKPELIFIKNRDDAATNWAVGSSQLSTDWVSGSPTLLLNSNSAAQALGYWTLAPTSSVFYVNNQSIVNGFSSNRHVAYLFATCPGVSKVGKYTGTGTTQQINCGFTSGARLIIIKRIDSTGDWYAWDTARGITSGNDPFIYLNLQGGNQNGTDYIDPYSAGFEISSTAPAGINASGGTYLYLAIA